LLIAEILLQVDTEMLKGVQRFELLVGLEVGLGGEGFA
jgi:hypothetical protein